MARRRDRSGERIEALAKAALGVLMLLALAIGGVGAFVPTLLTLLKVAAIIGGIAVAVVVVVALLVRSSRNNSTEVFLGRRAGAVRTNVGTHAPSEQGSGSPAAALASCWTAASIRSGLDEIDWYQFEKFCAALLHADGFQVERNGGAQPDGGVDLIVAKGEARALIQCKHWRKWVVQERVVREMLGSMAHFKVTQGAIYTLKGWTEPANRFAAQHAITLVNGDELAASAAWQLGHQALDELLRSDLHHCPKCEAPMILRRGAFGQFWGCSRYPSCRGKLKQSDS